MRELLLINASPHGETSAGYGLAIEWVDSLRSRHAPFTLTQRDLTAHPLLPISDAYATALTQRNPVAQPALELSEQLIGELERCDLLLIATPMHNFTVPAALKLWIDYVVRIGRSFEARPDGKVGLLRNRPVYIIVSSGGFHLKPRGQQADFLTPYLLEVLKTIGLFDVHFVYLEGMVLGEEVSRAAFIAAAQQLAGHSVPGD